MRGFVNENHGSVMVRVWIYLFNFRYLLKGSLIGYEEKFAQTASLSKTGDVKCVLLCSNSLFGPKCCNQMLVKHSNRSRNSPFTVGVVPENLTSNTAKQLDGVSRSPKLKPFHRSKYFKNCDWKWSQWRR